MYCEYIFNPVEFCARSSSSSLCLRRACVDCRYENTVITIVNAVNSPWRIVRRVCVASTVQLHRLASGASTQVSVTSCFYAHVQNLFGVIGGCSECVHTAIFVCGWNDPLVKVNFADAACNRSDAAWHVNAHVSLRLRDDIVVFLFVKAYLIQA